ncbi:PBSX family phage terminase large subunit [Peptoniphilus harei]|uniref:PBSX family phage terminase large subunit n=1 Tax=Peptoniphilus harei TaxID=54005 RepID=UPI00189A731E|nr:PBSX family phage terminase large subunit [Peptoniphilus harei]
MTQIKLSEVFTKSFIDLHKKIKSEDFLKYVLKGGRASGKSSFIAQEIILDIIKYPITVLCVRKVGNTLQESCYEQIKEAIDQLNLNDYFKLNISPLKITYTPRGNSIIFRGADDPAKIKSIKMAKYPIARLWIEELAEFKTEDEVSMIENSILRGELDGDLKYKFYYSYNPPKRKQSWVNKRYETNFLPQNTFVHHSCYLDNPFISKAFREEAEHIKATKPLKYRWEYLGEPIGSGVVPFDNLVFQSIKDEEIRNFDNLRQGIDWGYANDPFAFIRLHYDKTRRKIYIFDEIYQVKLSNRKAFELINKRGYRDCKIIADSAEPKSVDEMRSYGLRIEGARKGQGSVEYGEKWLDDLEAIVIDPKRCPFTTREFENIDYAVDKDGNSKNRLEDKDNHAIDAIRYALSEDMRGNLFSFN